VTIRFQCENCGKRYRVSDEMAGRRYRCRQCGKAAVVPALESAPSASEAHPTANSGAEPDVGELRIELEAPAQQSARAVGPQAAQAEPALEQFALAPEPRAERAPAGEFSLETPAGDDGQFALSPEPEAASAPPPTAGPDAAAGGGTCPSCGAGLLPNAVFCVGCGFDLRTGRRGAETKVIAGEPKAEEAVADVPRFVLPTAKIGAAVVVLVAVGAIWFFFVRPWRARAALEQAFAPALQGDAASARQNLEALVPRMPGSLREKAQFMADQMKLEALLGAPAFKRGMVELVGWEPATQKDDVLMRLRVTVRNKTARSLVLHNEYFYLRGESGIVPAAENTLDPVEGLAIRPNKRGSGLVAFWKLPGVKGPLLPTDIVNLGPISLVYNDGRYYHSVPADVLAFFPQGAGLGDMGGQVPVPGG